MSDMIYSHLHGNAERRSPIIPLELERLQMCQMVPDMQQVFRALRVTGYALDGSNYTKSTRQQTVLGPNSSGRIDRG